MTQSPIHKPVQRAPDFKARFGVVPDTPPPKLTRLQQRKQKRGRFTLGAIVFSLLLGSAGSAAFFIAKDMKSYATLFGGSVEKPAAAEQVAEAPPAAPINKSTTAESPVLLPEPEPEPEPVAAAVPEPASEPVAAAPQPVNQAPPVVEPEPVAEPPTEVAVTAPAPAPVSEPIVATVMEPVAQPVPEPVPEPAPVPVVVAAAPMTEQPEQFAETETVEAAANTVQAESAPAPEAAPQVAVAAPVVIAVDPAAATPVAKAGSTISLLAGQVFRDCDNCPDVVVVVPPKRALGANEVQVTLQADTADIAPFAIGRFEVTFDDWGRCMAGGGCSDNPSDEGWGRNARPVINVSHEMATGQYLAWLSKMTGATYRLPTAAEWDFAESGAGALAPGGARLMDALSVCQSGNYSNAGGSAEGEAACADGFPTTAPAGSLKPNGLGLSDMRGNVWEWVEDCWSPGFKYRPKASEQDCHKRLLRGGSWSSQALLSAKPAAGFEAVSRLSKTIGFRVARTLP